MTEEVLANAGLALSVLLAARNSVHTWWTGIVSSLLFLVVFYREKLYADVTLQVFFVVTSVLGWWAWQRGQGGAALPVRRSAGRYVFGLAVAAVASALAYGTLLHHLTDAYAPHWDSIVLTFSVLGQFLLMGRRVETWWCWLVVDSVAVPLYTSRELYVTAGLYAAFWINAWIGLRRWRRELRGA